MYGTCTTSDDVGKPLRLATNQFTSTSQKWIMEPTWKLHPNPIYNLETKIPANQNKIRLVYRPEELFIRTLFLWSNLQN